MEVLKRDRSLNNLASYRSAAQELALRNAIDLDSTAHEDALCRALLEAEIKVAVDMLTYLRDVVLPHHPLHAAVPQNCAEKIEMTRVHDAFCAWKSGLWAFDGISREWLSMPAAPNRQT